MSDNNEIDVEAVENVMPEAVARVREALSPIDGVEFAANHEEVYLSVRYPSDRTPAVERTLRQLRGQLPVLIDDDIKTKEAGMEALRVYPADRA